MKVFYDDKGNRVFELGFADVAKLLLGRELKYRVSVVRAKVPYEAFNIAAPAAPGRDEIEGFLHLEGAPGDRVARATVRPVGMPRFKLAHPKD